MPVLLLYSSRRKKTRAILHKGCLLSRGFIMKYYASLFIYGGNKPAAISDRGPWKYAAGVVALSNLNSKRLERIIDHKRSAWSPHGDKDIIAHHANDVKRESAFAFEDGEIMAQQIRQVQRRDFGEEEVTAIIAAYRSGNTTGKLAADYGCHRNTISNLLKRHGIEPTKKRIKSEELSERIIILYERGLIAAEIAKQIEVSATTVQRHLHENGVRVRGRWG